MKHGKKMKKDEKVDGSLYSNNDIITMYEEGMAATGCAFFVCLWVYSAKIIPSEHDSTHFFCTHRHLIN